MPQPTNNQVHIDALLTTISTAYIQGSDAFIASKVFPIVPVEKKSDLYFTYTKADWFRDEAKARADGEESVGSGYGLSTDSYNCITYAFHKDVGDQIRANSDSPLNPDRDATEFVTQRLILRKEKQWVSDVFTTSKWATDMTPANLWSDYAASNPINDIEVAKRTILLNTGYLPNTLAMGYDVFIQLKNHPDLVDRIKYTGGIVDQIQTEKNLAQLFGLKNVYIAQAINNTAAEGITAVYAFTHGKHALLCYVPPNPGLLTPAAGYTFLWRGAGAGLGANATIKRFRMEERASDRIEGQMAFANKIVGSDLGYFFNGAVA